LTWSEERAEEHLLSLELFAAIHVVGTNGKSSTVRMTAALLEAHGVRTGSYLSPHLVRFAERIRIGDEDLPGGAFGAAVERAAAAASKVDRTLSGGERVTQFELLTAAALDELARSEVEVAVVEAGLGGRWDATNVLDAGVCVLTNVGLEHTRWLGPTVADIAREKLAVVRPSATLVLGDADAEVRALAEATGARIVGAEPLEIALRGYQRTNFEVAAAAAQAHTGGQILQSSIAEVAARVRVPGRLQVVGEDPLTVLDGAHNPSGMAALAAALPDVVGDRPLVAVVSVLDDKDAAGMLRALVGKCSAMVCTASRNPRALPPATLASLIEQLSGPPAEVVRDPHAALERARELAGPAGAVLATGSIYLVADLVGEAAGRRASAL
jgi:dihydrofolate synthase/folylpolyglutamate synthase